MKTVSRALLALVVAIALVPSAQAQDTVTLTAGDGLVVTADVYDGAGAGQPWVVLAHMAGASRGEYREVAPRLVRLGFNAIALDQRSGRGFAGIDNQTSARAQSQGLATAFADARPDIEAGLAYARAQGDGPVLLWGSSYSAALALVIAGEDPGTVDGVISMSPGEYLRGISVTGASAGIQAPVLIVSPESERGQWQGMLAAIPHEDKQGFTPSRGGRHGTSALIPSIGSNAEEHWQAVEAFLARYFST